MPLYIRHNVSWTPTSLKEESFQLDESDFVQDPDLNRDVLPQPYRMINKVLWSVIDEVWEHINERESERLADASRLRPPQYQCRLLTELDSPLSKAECMSATVDGHYVVIGLKAGLAVLSSDTGTNVDLWLDDNLHITSIHTTLLASGKHLISTIDDMGQARLFAIVADHIYHLYTVNDSTSENKTIVTSCRLSSGGDYLTVFMEKPSSQLGWLEVHKLPKESWIKELDTLVAKSGQKEAVQEENITVDGTETTARSNESCDDQQSQTPGTQGSGRATHKFAATTIHCKVLPPVELTGVTGSLQQSMKALDVNCDVIGTGAHHMITASHLDQRNLMWKTEHEELIKYLPDDVSKPINQPTYHYMQPGRMIPHGLSNTSSGQPGVLVVWWQQCTQIMLYSLNKQAKELERKPDGLIPVSSFVVSSDVSEDGTKLVLALDNNNLVVWDIYLGVPKHVKHLTDEGHVVKVNILDPNICPQDNTEYPPYPISTNYYVMVTMDTGQLYLVNCGYMTDQPLEVDLCIVNENEVPTICQTVDGLPNLLLTCRRNGQIFLHDLRHGNQLCEVTLPPEYELVSPWQPVMCLGSKGRMVYVKGQKKSPEAAPGEDEEAAVTLPDMCLFTLELFTFLPLDKYMIPGEEHVPFVVHSTVSNRVNALLKERISQQGIRVTRMQSRWMTFKDEINNIVKIQENADKLNVLSKSSMKDLPILTGVF